MKKIINGRLYNTETSVVLAKRESGYFYGDYRSFEEILYKKSTGEYFLYGTGGALSKYAMEAGGDIMAGENIFPLTEEEATQWAEKYLTCEQYVSIFGEVKE